MVQPKGIETVYELLRIFLVGRVECLDDGGVRALFKRLSQRDHAIPALSVLEIGVFYLYSGQHLINAILRVDVHGSVHSTVLQCSHQGDGLEGGTGFGSFPDGIIALFVVAGLLRIPPQIGDGTDGSGLHLHQYRTAVIRLMSFQGTQKCMMGDVLQPAVNGADQVHSVLRVRAVEVR